MASIFKYGQVTFKSEDSTRMDAYGPFISLDKLVDALKDAQITLLNDALNTKEGVDDAEGKRMKSVTLGEVIDGLRELRVGIFEKVESDKKKK